MSDKNLRVKRHLTRRIKLLMRYVCGGERIPAISYFPEQPHKSKARIFGDQCVHILKYGEVDPYYYLYGLDVKGASFKKKGLISYKEFMDWRNLHNRPVHPFNYICILRDKKLFAIVCEHFGIPCVRDLGYIDPGITVNIIKDGALVEKKKLSLPEHLINVIICKNPRCITTVEGALDQHFILKDRERGIYRCRFCDAERKSKALR